MSTRHKILVVDDNTANLTTCKTILKDLYDVYTATSAVSMMSLLKNITPDLIMLDVKMPDINGYETARLLKNDTLYRNIPIIFVSALSDVESEMEGLELGAVDYISKPYFPPILIQRIKTHLDLIDKTKQLETASQAKTNFLANMSHEMRTPLTAVLGLTELISNTVRLDEETNSNLMKIHRAGETLLSLINDILDISKIEVGRLTLNPADYDVSAMLGDIITQCLQYNAESKPIEFVLDITEDLPKCLHGDELRIKQILNNLLSNAFKFTQEGTVELGIRCEKGDGEDDIQFTARVRDTGSGIRPEDIEKLFTTYPKMEEEITQRSVNRRTEGTGLGLFISKRVAEMMDGTITVESVYKKGTCFTVKLRQKRVSGDVLGKKTAEDLRNLHFISQGIKDAGKPRINMSYARVLVVDDNVTNLDVAKGLISLYGIKVDCMTGGQQAVAAVRKGEPEYNAIFIDHLMPEMDGLETARIIREEIGTGYAKTVPLIALTANAMMGNEEMFLRSGFQAFISKPVELLRLDSVLKQWVRDKEAEALLPEKTISAGGKSVKRKMLSRDIPGLNTEKGIMRYGGSETAYIEILRSYAGNTKKLIDTIRTVSADNLSYYHTIVHGIKGSSLGICAEAVGNAAQALEDAAESGDFDFVSSENPGFVEAVTQLITDIEDACEEALPGQKPVRLKPDRALLIRLQDALESLDIDEMDAAMEEMSKYDYAADDGLSSWLRTSLKQGKYKEIKERLKEL